jgi:nicotinamide-nucleotide amidase
MPGTIETLAGIAGARLKSAGFLLASAESCTGGWVSQAVTAVAGSSEWFDRGFVVYSNEAKREMLGVAGDTLARCGAVSEDVAREMAVGAIDRSRARLALAITGIAGPSGGTPGKPVGMVCFAWAVREDAPAPARGGIEARSETRHFGGDRESVRRQAVIRALQGVIELLDGRALQS